MPYEQNPSTDDDSLFRRAPHQLGPIKFEQLYTNGIAMLQDGDSNRNAIANDLNRQVQCYLVQDDAGHPYNVYPAPIGEGAFAFVYVGVNLFNGQPCAVKSLKNVSDKKALKRLSDEAEILRKLNGLQGFLKAEHHVLVFENFHHGSNLEHYFFGKEGKSDNLRSWGERLDIVCGLIDEVISLHDKGLMHRDLKLENVMYDPVEKKVHMCDFGMADDINNPSQKAIGSPLYMAPEMDNRAVDVKCDYYALAVLIAFCMSNKSECYISSLVYRCLGDIYSSTEINRLILNSIPEFKTTFPSSLENELWSYLEQMISADPDHRPTAADIKQRFEAFREAYQSSPKRLQELLEAKDETPLELILKRFPEDIKNHMRPIAPLERFALKGYSLSYIVPAHSQMGPDIADDDFGIHHSEGKWCQIL